MSQILKRYTKQLTIIFILIIAVVTMASYITSSQLSDSLTSIYMNKLTALKSSLKVNVESYFEKKRDIVNTIATSKDSVNALVEFTHSFDKVQQEYNKSIDKKVLISTIETYTSRVQYSLPSSPQKKDYEEYLSKNNNGLILQSLYIAQSPFESQDKYLLHSSNESLSYDKTHKSYHSKFINILKRHNFYDIFLIDNQGNIVYSVFKELDFATNLENGVHKNSSLAIAYKQAMKSEKIIFSDFKPYEASYNKPAAFFIMPIHKDGKKIGAIAFQISIEEIDEIMTFSEKWVEIGLGESGESYLVGQDYLMRSNSRFILDLDNKLVNELSTTVGVLNVKSPAIKNALEGENDYEKVKDYRGIDVLSSYTPVNILDTRWALAVEIDAKEINKEILSVIKTILSTGIILVILFMLLLGYTLLRLIVRPIESFERELDFKVNEKTKELRASAAILKDYKNAVDEGSIVSKTDTRGIIKYVNDAFCKISGYSRDELIGQPHNIVRHPDSPKNVFEDVWRTIENKRIWKGVIKNRTKDGGEYIVQSTIVPILDEHNKIVEFISIRSDITELVQNEKKVIEQSTDSLTKLPNRIKLFEDINMQIDEPKLALLQIDKFKEINDFHSSEKGDLILISIASILGKITSNKDLQVYKVGTDEFAIIASQKASMSDFVKILENIIKYFDLNVVGVGNDSFNISVTVGVASGDKEKLFFNAEMGVRKAYENSKALMAFENADDMEKEYQNNISMTKKIKDAIKNDDITIFAQPIITNKENGKSKYECLIRMKDGDKIISPFFFLEIAKKARLYPTLTKIVIEKSFAYFTDKKDEFSINLTIEDILNDDIIGYLKKKIDFYKVGHRLVIELVESEGIENFDDVHAFIKEVKGYGCKIAIDDFGTGYSNFEYLIKLDVDYIKIDGSLIKNIDTDKSAQLVVELIIDFAKKMEIKTIAEFIHNEEVYEKTKSMGIDYSQGYHLGEPIDMKYLV